MALDSPKASISQAWATGHTSTGTLEEWKIEDSLKEATRAITEFTDSKSRTTNTVAVQHKTEDTPAVFARSASRQESANQRPLSVTLRDETSKGLANLPCPGLNIIRLLHLVDELHARATQFNLF